MMTSISLSRPARRSALGWTAGHALLLLLTGCRPSVDAKPEASAPAPLVEAVEARSGSLPLEERLNGLVRARNQVEVRPEISAQVVDVLVESGDEVTQGQVLVRLDDVIVGQQLRQAQASQRLAAAEAKAAAARFEELRARVLRSRKLAQQELISDLDLEMQEAQLTAAEAVAEQAEARVDAAAALVDERRADLARTEVRSPVAGRLGQRRVEVGMLVGSSTLLFQVGNLERVQVEVPLTEAMLAYLSPGQTAVVQAQGAEPLQASLSRISPFLEGGSFSTVGEIDLDNPDGRLRPGMFVSVDILYGESQRATLVPSAALWDDPRTGELGVYVVEGAGSSDSETEPPRAVRLAPVEVLAQGRATLGLTGVEPGAWVVTLGQHLLTSESDAAARVRPTEWERVLELQGLQREDLLRGFLAKQQRLASQHGAAVPSSQEYLGAGAE